MPRWEIRVREQVLQQDAANWLIALGLAVESLGLDAESLSRMVCDLREDGGLWIREPIAGLTIQIRRSAETPRRAPVSGPNFSDGSVEDIFSLDVEEPPPPPPPPSRSPARFAMADANSEEEEDDTLPGATPGSWAMPSVDPWADGLDDQSDSSPPPLSLSMPRLEQAAPPPPEEDPFFDDDVTPLRSPAAERMPMELAIVLLERGIEIAQAKSPAEAADLALTVLRQAVPAESGAVLLRHREGLQVIAAQGPAARSVQGLTLATGQGLAGYSVSRGESLIVQNAQADIRHDRETDARTGYATKAVLVVPLKDASAAIHGCVQLLNPPARFLQWHLEAAQSVAVALAEALRSAR